MEIFQKIEIIILIGFLFLVAIKSVKAPKPSTMQVIKFFNKPYTVISNIEGKRINNPDSSDFDDSKEPWDLIDEDKDAGKRLNISFYLWPIFTTHEYDFEYPKRRNVGEEEPGDVVVWKNETSKECIVSRKGKSDHIRFRVEYPTVTPQLDTEEMATINVLTDNILEAVNPMKMLFQVDNYLGVATRSIHGALRGLVGSMKLQSLNSIQKENKDAFNDTMHDVNGITGHPGIQEFGIILFKSVFNDFEPVNETAKTLMTSFSNVSIAEEEGKAAIAKQEGETKAFVNKKTSEIDMFVKDTDAQIQQEKKRRIQIGIAKTDAQGNITELIPDANVKATTEAIKELSNLKGTLIMDGGVTKMLNINPTQNDK